MARIGQLYAIEGEIRRRAPDERRKMRQSRSRTLLESQQEWFASNLAKLSAKSDTASAIRYALARRSALGRFCDDRRFEIDSNAAERALRAVATYNLISSAKLNGLDQEGPFNPLTANIFLEEVNWFFDAVRRKTAEGACEAVNYRRFGDHIVTTIGGHHTKRGWAEPALQPIREQFALIGVELNLEKTKVMDALKGEAVAFLGFDLRRVRKRNGNGCFVMMTPKKKARKVVKAKIRDIVGGGGATP